MRLRLLIDLKKEDSEVVLRGAGESSAPITQSHTIGMKNTWTMVSKECPDVSMFVSMQHTFVVVVWAFHLG
jgi:hypothetical protein